LGVSSTEARALFSLKRRGELGNEFLSLGRPELYISKRELTKLVSAYNLPWSEIDIDRVVSTVYAEPLLRLLGFQTIRSIDISAYQDADIIHNLNLPIPKELEATTGFLYGNGTLEHIFDIATVLRNIVKLVKVGGTVFVAAPANGLCGHGFYQFSPEFFYNFFSVNGFDRTRVYVVGRNYPPRWFRAANPKVLKQRIEFMTAEPTDIIAIARKAENIPDFAYPQQSDYADDSWHMSPKESEEAHAGWARQPSIYAKLRKRASLASAVALRYLTGHGMPGIPGRPYFDPIDPFVDEL
jgi:hypothetical protein